MDGGQGAPETTDPTQPLPAPRLPCKRSCANLGEHVSTADVTPTLKLLCHHWTHK